MRIADPAELTAEASLESVLTAVMPRYVVEGMSNAMRDVDQFNAPGPAKMAVLQLDAGPMVAIVHHEAHDLIEILAPVDPTVEMALAEVVTVLRIPRTAIEWVREGVSLSRVYQDIDAGQPAHVL
jgi:hypothetical protein